MGRFWIFHCIRLEFSCIARLIGSDGIVSCTERHQTWLLQCSGTAMLPTKESALPSIIRHRMPLQPIKSEIYPRHDVSTQTIQMIQAIYVDRRDGNGISMIFFFSVELASSIFGIQVTNCTPSAHTHKKRYVIWSSLHKYLQFNNQNIHILCVARGIKIFKKKKIGKRKHAQS